MTTLNFDIDTSAKTTVLQWAMRWRQSYFLLFLQFVNWPTNQEIILMGIVCNYYILFLSYTGLQDNSTFSKIDLEDNGMTGKHIHALAEMLLQNHYVSDIVSTPDCSLFIYYTHSSPVVLSSIWQVLHIKIRSQEIACSYRLWPKCDFRPSHFRL